MEGAQKSVFVIVKEIIDMAHCSGLLSGIRRGQTFRHIYLLLGSSKQIALKLWVVPSSTKLLLCYLSPDRLFLRFMLKEQILALVRRYLEEGINRSAFSEQFASLYFQVRNSRIASPDVQRLSSSLMLPFAELSQGHRTEASFRQELENAIRPFAPVKLRLGEAVGYAVPMQAGNNSAVGIPLKPSERAGSSANLWPPVRLVAA